MQCANPAALPVKINTAEYRARLFCHRQSTCQNKAKSATIRYNSAELLLARVLEYKIEWSSSHISPSDRRHRVCFDRDDFRDCERYGLGMLCNEDDADDDPKRGKDRLLLRVGPRISLSSFA